MRLAHLSDLHFGASTWNLFSKRILGTLNWLLRRRHDFIHERLDPLPALFSELKVDLILVTGDLTTTGLPAELCAAQEALGRFEQPLLLLPGNHDQYTRGSFRRKTFYKWCANPTTTYSLREHGLEHHVLANGWNLILLDTAPATPLRFSGGHFSPALEARLETLLASLQGPTLVANHFPYFLTPKRDHRLLRGEALEQLLARHRVRLYLHGHTHRHILANLQPSGLPITLDAGSATYRRQATFNILDLTAQECTVTPHRFSGGQWEREAPETMSWAIQG